MNTDVQVVYLTFSWVYFPLSKQANKFEFVLPIQHENKDIFLSKNGYLFVFLSG